MEHALVITRWSYFSSVYVYSTDCTCGRYHSGKYTDDMRAWNAGQEHVKAKEGSE